MEIKEIKTIMLEASEGHILTNGKAYGKIVALGATDSVDNWYEITEEEYNEAMIQDEPEEIL